MVLICSLMCEYQYSKSLPKIGYQKQVNMASYKDNDQCFIFPYFTFPLHHLTLDLDTCCITGHFVMFRMLENSLVHAFGKYNSVLQTPEQLQRIIFRSVSGASAVSVITGTSLLVCRLQPPFTFFFSYITNHWCQQTLQKLR